MYIFIAFTLEHKTSDVDNNESFEMFYRKYQEQVYNIVFKYLITYLVLSDNSYNLFIKMYKFNYICF